MDNWGEEFSRAVERGEAGFFSTPEGHEALIEIGRGIQYIAYARLAQERPHAQAPNEA